MQVPSVEWFNNNFCLKHHNPRYCIFSVPNEATYNNNNFKALGVKEGVSDVVVVLKNKTLYIEFKTETGTQSDEQKDFEKTVTNLGHEYYLIRSFEQFKELICKQLQLKE